MPSSSSRHHPLFIKIPVPSLNSPVCSLQTKREEHQQKPRPRKQFQQPSQYARGALKRKLAARTDPYIKRSRALWQIHDAMPPWLWTACNEALNAHNTPPADSNPNGSSPQKGKGRGKFKPLFDTDKKREREVSPTSRASIVP